MFRFTRAKSSLRPLAAMAVLGLTALGVNACGSSTSSGTAAADEGSATSGNVTWWGWTPQPAGAERYIAAFNKEYPDIKITYKQLTIDGWNAALKPALASSSGPDLYGINPGVRMDDFSSFAVDLAPAMEKTLGSDWKSKVAPLGIEGLTTKSGKLAAVSVGSTYSGSVWVNKNLFDKFQLTPPRTVEEWAKVCGVFKQNGVTCFVQGAAQIAFNRDTLQAISNTIEPGTWNAASTGDKKWTDPTIVKALTTWKRLFTDGIMQDGALGVQQYPDANNQFMSGKAAMVMMGTWYTQYATTAGMTPAISAAGVADPKPFPIVPIPFPSASGSPSTDFILSGDSDYGLAVNNKSKVKAAATTFATWLGTSKTGQQEVANVLNDIAALNGTAPNWESIPLTDKSVQQAPVQKMIEQSATVKEPRLGLVGADLLKAIGVASTTVAEGTASPEDAAKTLQASAEAAGLKFK